MSSSTLPALQFYKIVSLLHYELRQDEWKNAVKIPSVLVPSAEAKVQGSIVVVVSRLLAGSPPNRDSITTMIKRR